MHDTHTTGTVLCVLANQNRTGIQRAALCETNEKKEECEQRESTGNVHTAIADRIAGTEKQHGFFCADPERQKAREERGKDIADGKDRQSVPVSENRSP